MEYVETPIRINAVCPGWVRTEMADETMAWLARKLGIGLEEAYAVVTRDVPSRRPAVPEEIADAVAWLLSDAAGYLAAMFRHDFTLAMNSRRSGPSVSISQLICSAELTWLWPGRNLCQGMRRSHFINASNSATDGQEK